LAILRHGVKGNSAAGLCEQQVALIPALNVTKVHVGTLYFRQLPKLPNLESKETKNRNALLSQPETPGRNMGKRYYVAVYTDSDCLCGCDHKHQNVTTATACISEPGGYVVAVRRRKYLPLTEAEEAQFQEAMSGQAENHKEVPDLSLLINGKLETQS